MATVEWFYAKDNRQYGPISAAELKQLADTGALQPEDLVWRDGMEEWSPARKVKGLFEEPGAPAAVAGKGPAQVAGAAPAVRAAPQKAPTARLPRRHPMDLLLDMVRAQFTLPVLDSTRALFTAAGHFGLYVGVLAMLGFHFLLAIRTNRLHPILTGLAVAGVLVVLQYAAFRFSGALDRLMQATPGRICSTAPLDCFAVLHVLMGLVVVLGLSILAAQTGQFLYVLPAVAAFIVCEYTAAVALHPQAIQLTVTPEASAGEEALGVVSFVLKMGVRVVPVAFGVGVSWATIQLLVACAQLLLGQPATATLEPMPLEPIQPGETAAWTGAALLVGAAALPPLAYALFVVGHLSVDVLRAVLALPRKLDRLGGAKADRG